MTFTPKNVQFLDVLRIQQMPSVEPVMAALAKELVYSEMSEK